MKDTGHIVFQEGNRSCQKEDRVSDNTFYFIRPFFYLGESSAAYFTVAFCYVYKKAFWIFRKSGSSSLKE